ncbi:membrane protein [Yersinia wautersii]|uniref:Membrane protein n=1 Tax=Yersinia wautersii TaxID=1341643 RepID=A0ABM9TBF4_9GAMM|nr:membrane protein [Yersinia wautersii]
MTYKKYNASWEGYMGDVLNGNVGINQLKPQHEYFDAIGLGKVLSENTQYHAVLTLAEAKSIIEDINPSRTQSPSNGEALARGFEIGNKVTNPVARVFSVTDPISAYAGNIYDSRGVYDVIREFKRFSITATEYVGENGRKYIHISGYAGLRRIITGTRYGASHPQMLSMGIGQQGLSSNIVKGLKFCILFSIGYRTIEGIFKDEYTLAEFIGNITMDMAKTAIVAAVSFSIGSVLTASAILGGSIIAVACVVLIIGFFAASALSILDEKYGISEKLIVLLTKEMRKKPRTPEADFQYIINGLGRLR